MIKYIPYIKKFLILVIVIIVICFGISKISHHDEEENIVKDEKIQSTIIPNIKLQKSVNKGTVRELTIYATFSTENEKGIAYIVMPDGEKITQNGETRVKTEYKVTENGTYLFKVCDADGNESEESVEITNIKENLSLTPYIPEDFKYVEGKVEDGYVIEDKYGNQYVWVPVETGNMKRSKSADSKYFEDEDCSSEFVNSVAQNYGFYIARYEASASLNEENENVAISQKGEIPWTNIDYSEAFSVARSASNKLGYTDCHTALVNSYAWDTALTWINTNYKNYSTSDQFGNYSGEIKTTGDTAEDEVNKICDMAGNVREWTTEGYKEITDEKDKKDNKEQEEKDCRIVRAGSATTDRTASSSTAYEEDKTDDYWGFRIILYK